MKQAKDFSSGRAPRACRRPGVKSPLTKRQIQLLRGSFRVVERSAGIAGLIFYRNLFALDPSLRRLFQTSVELQGRKLMDALGYTVATLEQPRALIPVLHALGRRHAGYRVLPEHYATLNTALLQTLAQIVGVRFSPATRQAWVEALDFIAITMQAGAAESTDIGPATLGGS